MTEFNAETLRYVSLVLIGLLLMVSGWMIFFGAGDLQGQVPDLVPTAEQYAPNAVPILESIQSFLGTVKIFSIVLFVVGILTAISGALSILEEGEEEEESPFTWAGGESGRQ